MYVYTVCNVIFAYGCPTLHSCVLAIFVWVVHLPVKYRAVYRNGFAIVASYVHSKFQHFSSCWKVLCIQPYTCTNKTMSNDAGDMFGTYRQHHSCGRVLAKE